MKNKIEWAILIAIVGVAMWLGAYLFTTEPVVPETIIETDTVTVVEYIKSDPIIIEKQVTVRDTIYIDSKGDSVETGVARLDSIFDSGAELEVSYFLSPRVFEINFTEAPIEIREVKVTETRTEFIDTHKWWDRAKYGFYVGVTTASAIVYLLK